MKALEFSLSDDLEGIDVQGQIGNDPFEPAILILERAHLGDVTDLEAAVLRLDPFASIFDGLARGSKLYVGKLEYPMLLQRGKLTDGV